MKRRARAALFAGLVMLLAAMEMLLLQSGWAPAQRIAAASETVPANSRAAGRKVLVTGVRSTLSDGYVRITVALSQEAKFEVRSLLDKLSDSASPRIYVDIFGADLALAAKQPVEVDDKLVRQVRVGQYNADVVRVVLDLQSRTAHNAFMLSDPYRLIIDIAGERNAAPAGTNDHGANNPAVTRKPPDQQPRPALRRLQRTGCVKWCWIQDMAAKTRAPWVPEVSWKKTSRSASQRNSR